MGRTTLRLPGGHEIFVTNKYVILSGPEEWLDPVGLASLAAAMRESQEPARDLYGQDYDPTGRLYCSADPRTASTPNIRAICWTFGWSGRATLRVSA